MRKLLIGTTLTVLSIILFLAGFFLGRKYEYQQAFSDDTGYSQTPTDSIDWMKEGKPKVEFAPLPKITYESRQLWKPIYKDSLVKIVGDSLFKGRFEVHKRFTFHKVFSDFSVDTLITPVKPNLNLESHPAGKTFVTRITGSYDKAKKPNFAGHYSLIYWGCGAPCRDGVIVDWIDGRIYSIPDACLDYGFTNASRLLILDDFSDNQGYYYPFPCRPVVYEFNEQTKEFALLYEGDW